MLYSFLLVTDILSLLNLCSLVASIGPLNHREDFEELGGAVNLLQEHELVFALKQKNLNLIEGILHRVSDPYSVDYGKYLSRQQVGEITYNPDGSEAISTYLKVHGIFIVSRSLYDEYITVKATLGKWEELLHAKFNSFRHKTKGVVVFRSNSFTLDQSIEFHLSHIYNLVELPFLPSTIFHVSSSAQYTGVITPAVLNSYYNIFTNTGSTAVKQTIYSSSGQYFSSADLASFQTQYNIPSHPVDADPNNANQPGQCSSNVKNCYESSLDLQYIMAVAQNTYTSIM